ncbi:MAG: hypothetical protein KF861_01310 [Planctomycetaceae bacterium]|nr:hypothetical protein [Planctomycetaceae bacterium]
MRKRVVGATLLVAIGIGVWLSSLFKGLGPGGEGTGVGHSDNVSVSLKSSHSAVESRTTPASADADGVSQSAGTVPTVLIDGHQFLLQQGAGGEESFRPAELDEIVRLATQAQPGDDGVRIHVKRRQSARATAETALYEALQRARIEPHAIHEQKAFVE